MEASFRTFSKLGVSNQNFENDMATIKIKFRASLATGSQGSIFYQVIHHRVVRQKKTNNRLYDYEWDSSLSEVVFSTPDEDRRRYLMDINEKIRIDVKRLQQIISSLEHSGCNYTADDVIASFVSDGPENSFFAFME